MIACCKSNQCGNAEERNVETVVVLGVDKEIEKVEMLPETLEDEAQISPPPPIADPEPQPRESEIVEPHREGSYIAWKEGDSPEPGTEFTVDVVKPDGAGSDLGCQVFYAGAWVPLIILVTPKSGPLAGKVERYDRIINVNGVTGDADVVAKAVKEATSLKMTLRKPKFYTIEINKIAGQRVGLEFVYPTKLDEEFFVINGFTEGGIVEGLNGEYEDRAVRLYDCVVEVNGIRGCQAMLSEMEKSNKMVITMYRHFKGTELGGKV